jgi:hypothetical protein
VRWVQLAVALLVIALLVDAQLRYRQARKDWRTALEISRATTERLERMADEVEKGKEGVIDA